MTHHSTEIYSYSNALSAALILSVKLYTFAFKVAVFKAVKVYRSAFLVLNVNFKYHNCFELFQYIVILNKYSHI